MLDKVKKLFESTVTTYKISKGSGVPNNTVQRLRSGEAKLENATYKNIEALYNYYLKEMNGMKTWERKNKDGYFWYEINEVSFDGDLHEFMVVKEGGEVVGTITPSDLENQAEIIEDLNNGEGVNGWEDGMGNTIHID